MPELELTLPSGIPVRVRTAGEGAPIDDDVVSGKRMFAGRMLRALESGRLVVEGLPSAVDDLSLADFHALRDAAFRVGAIAEHVDPEERRCRNCEAALDPRPEDAPLADLDRWYVEREPEPFEGPFPLGSRIRVGRTDAETFVMEPVTVGRAKPLWRVLASEASGITPRIVRALGVRALGDVTDPGAIARALDRAPDDVWAVLETAFLLLNYAARSHFPYVCPKCGALHDLLAPAEREFDFEPHAEDLLLAGRRADSVHETAEPFPDPDGFAKMALRIGREVYRDRGVRNVELVVDEGVPPVDGSGEPLLGSYRPIVDEDAAGYSEVRFQIDVFYETFAKMYEDAPFDLEAELRDTIDHEVQHHLAYLSGKDAVDEEERAEALAELERTYGARAVRRAQVKGVVSELRILGWFLLVALAVIGLITLIRGI